MGMTGACCCLNNLNFPLNVIGIASAVKIGMISSPGVPISNGIAKPLRLMTSCFSINFGYRRIIFQRKKNFKTGGICSRGVLSYKYGLMRGWSSGHWIRQLNKRIAARNLAEMTGFTFFNEIRIFPVTVTGINFLPIIGLTYLWSNHNFLSGVTGKNWMVPTGVCCYSTILHLPSAVTGICLLEKIGATCFANNRYFRRNAIGKS